MICYWQQFYWKMIHRFCVILNEKHEILQFYVKKVLAKLKHQRRYNNISPFLMIHSPRNENAASGLRLFAKNFCIKSSVLWVLSWICWIIIVRLGNASMFAIYMKKWCRWIVCGWFMFDRFQIVLVFFFTHSRSLLFILLVACCSCCLELKSFSDYLLIDWSAC